MSEDEDAMMKTYAVEHMLFMIREWPDAVYCMPLVAGCRRRLLDLLAVKDLSSDWDDLGLNDFLPNLEALGLPAHLKDVLYIVRRAVSRT